jgi:hypothetical protein
LRKSTPNELAEKALRQDASCLCGDRLWSLL